MIAVIADDITGAAEMGGIALRYGLHAVVSDDVNLNSVPDVLIVYTNARSMQQGEAVKLMEKLTKKIAPLNPSLFYKKTDSVLRGHVLAELKAQMKVTDRTTALLVPVNPSLGRTIKNGHYFINDQLIHETGFSSDPEFPIVDSEVAHMLGSKEIRVLSRQSLISGKGILIGEADTNDDVTKWASQVDERIVPVGGGSFFDALLTQRFQKKAVNTELQLSSPMLLVSGTAYKKSVERIQKHSQLVSYMPSGIFRNVSDDYETWRDDILSILFRHNKAIVAIENREGEKADPGAVRIHISQVIKLVFEKTDVSELFIEGGSTAYSIVDKLGWRRFIPTEEMQQGIVRMKVQGMENRYLTIKPGSYEWPAQWNFN